MGESTADGKVIPFRRGAPRTAIPRATAAGGGAARLPLEQMLDSLHPRVRAVLVLRNSKWELYERQPSGAPRPGILETIPLPDLLTILAKSAAAPSPASGGGHALAGSATERITLSPWPGFDLALLLRDGAPVYGLCLEPDTSIYAAEEALPAVARYFDHASAR